MDSSPPASSILDTLRTVEFRLGIKGYNVDEVDEYLDRAAQEAEALQESLRQVNDRLRQASDRIVQLEKDVRDGSKEKEVAAPAAPAAPPSTAVDIGPSDETLQRTLLLAQKFVDQIKRESEAEAAATVSSAEDKARAAISSAEEAARTLKIESERQVRADVSRLEATRTELATDVEAMARHLESERNRLRDTLTEILRWVDENVQPVNSLMGVRPKDTKPALEEGSIAVQSSGPAVFDVDEVDDQPTLSLQSVTDTTETGVSRQH